MSVPGRHHAGIEIAKRLIGTGAYKRAIVGSEMQPANRPGVIREGNQLRAISWIYYSKDGIPLIVRRDREASAVGTDGDRLDGARQGKARQGFFARRIRPNRDGAIGLRYDNLGGIGTYRDSGDRTLRWN